jgi:RNA polymerase sigma-70 factor (ECF subfamily)
MPSDDEELLLRLLREHGAALVLYAQQFCGNPEDVVQEAFMRLFRERPRPANAVGWLYRVVRNAAIDASRAAARRTRHERLAADGRQDWFQPGVEEALDAETVISALGSLSVEDREIVVLRIWSNHTFDEIAALVGKSVSTVQRRFEASLRTLRAACIATTKRGDDR